jgi:NDP-sugar pyrophosphorylase family protein
MRPLTYWRPKPLVPIAGRPLIVHIVEGFARAGVRDICVVVGHLREQIQLTLGDGSVWGARLIYKTQPEPTGTGAAVLLAADFVGNEHFMLSWGDILVPQFHYGKVFRSLDGSVDGVLSVNRVDDPWEGAAVYVEDGIVTRIIEKPERGSSSTNYNNAGVLLLPPQVLEITATLAPSPRGEIELPQAVAEFIAEGGRLRAVEVEGYWSDVARPANVLAMNGAVIQAMYAGGIFVDHSAVVSADIEIQRPAVIAAGVRVGVGNVIGPNVAILEGACIGAGCTIAHAIVGRGAVIGENCQLRHVIAEDGVHVPDGTVLPGSPDRPLVLPPAE